MIKYHIEDENNRIVTVDSFPDNDKCWIQMIDPTDDELREITMRFDLPMEACRAALDLDERSRIDIDDNYRMLLVNIPTREETSDRELYTTIPLSMILAGNAIITICPKDTHILRGFSNGSERGFHPSMRSRCVFQILYATARRYLIYLRLVAKKIDAVELEFGRMQKNRELLELMKLQKSLVYFTTGLRSNEAVLDKLVRTDAVKKYEEDSDLLEDVIVENKQAIEMAKIDTEILLESVEHLCRRDLEQPERRDEGPRDNNDSDGDPDDNLLRVRHERDKHPARPESTPASRSLSRYR